MKFLNQRSQRHLQKLRNNTWKATKWQRKPKIKRWDIVRGDLVAVVNGEERGKQGKVLKVNNRTRVFYHMPQQTSTPIDEKLGFAFIPFLAFTPLFLDAHTPTLVT